jgi:uncharacterized protein DUF362
MITTRRTFLENSAAAGALALIRSSLGKARAGAESAAQLGIPGPYRGRVIAVSHPGSIVSGAYQAEPIQRMFEKGMMELTGAPSWAEAWRVFVRPGDVVGIKVSPVGGPKLCSDALVLRRIIDGLNQAGLPNRDIVVFSRYRKEIIEAGIDKWLPEGVRFTAPSEAFDNVQLGMEGYDPDHYMEMALAQPGQNINDEHVRRSYVAKLVTREINKFINLPTLKHHQSAGVTIALKNMSHGLVNNVCRSHSSPTLNACGVFIPSVVSLPVIRQKAVLHILDAVKASYHGGPGGNPKYFWEPKAMYFATDPVALDKTGWKVIDGMRAHKGMAPVASAKPDNDSHFLNCHVEHIEIAGALGLGEFDDSKIDLKRFDLT